MQNVWRAVFLLFLSRHGNGCCTDGKNISISPRQLQKRVLHGRPPSAEPGASSPLVRSLDARGSWRLVVTWSSPAVARTFEIQVARPDPSNIVDRRNVSRVVGFGAAYAWTWTSSRMPLKCANHFVRIRTFYNSSCASSWSPWKIHFGVRERGEEAWGKVQMFPSEEILLEASAVQFCCVAPKGTHVTDITFNNTRYPLITVSDRAAAITVAHLNATSTLGVYFRCRDSRGIDNFTSNFVTFPPQKPQNLSCETEDLRNITCTWDPGRAPNLYNRRSYTLHVERSGLEAIKCEVSSCSFLSSPHLKEYEVTLLVKNSLGEEKAHIAFNIIDIVFPVPKNLSIIPGVGDATVHWKIQGNFSGVHLLCHIQLEPGGDTMEVKQHGASEMHFNGRLENLKPSSQYSAKVHCAITGRQWGRWTSPKSFTTQPLVSLDVWRIVRGHPCGRSIVVVWKTHFSGPESHDHIKAYETQLTQNSHQVKVRVKPSEKHVEFPLDQHGGNVSISAIVQVGSSVPSCIRIPPGGTEENTLVPKRLEGSSTDGFVLRWTAVASATCGYMVDWCQKGAAAQPCSPSDLIWRTAPSGHTTMLLRAEDFSSGRRYKFRVFGCGQDGHHLLEMHIGYLKEQTPTQFPVVHGPAKVTSSSVTLEWSFREDDPLNPGFIIGYLVTVQEGHWNSRNSVSNSYNISLDNPQKKSLTLTHLMENSDYTFYIAALTTAGPGPQTRLTVRTSLNYVVLLAKLLIPVLSLLGGCLLLKSYWKIISDFLLEIYWFPEGLNVKQFELDSCLYEASEKIKALQVEECACCDIEILDVKPSESERKLLISPDDPDRQLPCEEPGDPQIFPFMWAIVTNSDMTNVANLTYLTSVSTSQYPVSSPSLNQTEASSSGYITTISTAK
ncbi:leukemia inhibitory factor receptor isoform X2 [Denticeps clupeoides]|uniref:leukemia inhibitory factor receptor isoform X2 n=1 Tax=Denticeps clupeoides TaxID=299321 RepID=UPI0010A5609D|nr:leukemia inhibitory factor receptor-like isoform X2 [Denticeps clupeoides]